jgi:hypothetical protein
MKEQDPERRSGSRLRRIGPAILVVGCVGAYLVLKHLGVWGIVRPLILRKSH